jgi:hypothetical protein
MSISPTPFDGGVNYSPLEYGERANNFPQPSVNLQITPYRGLEIVHEVAERWTSSTVLQERSQTPALPTGDSREPLGTNSGRLTDALAAVVPAIAGMFAHGADPPSRILMCEFQIFTVARSHGGQPISRSASRMGRTIPCLLVRKRNWHIALAASCSGRHPVAGWAAGLLQHGSADR